MTKNFNVYFISDFVYELIFDSNAYGIGLKDDVVWNKNYGFVDM